MASTPLCIAILVVNEASSSVTVPPPRQGPCSDNARRGPTPEAISKISSLYSAGTSEINRKLRRRTLASAGRGQYARVRRGRNVMNSSIPGGSAESTRGGQVCQPGLNFANCFANGRKRLTDQFFSSRLAWVDPPGDQCPTLGPEGWLQPNVCCQCSKGNVSWRDSA